MTPPLSPAEGDPAGGARSGQTPHGGRIAGVDFGTVRVGLAVTDPGQRLASPLEVYRRRNREQDAVYFRRLVEREGIVQFVVGLPIHLSGDESPKSREARAFGEWLERETRVPVVLFDERFTTVEAEDLMRTAQLTRKRRAQRRDMVAAQRILAAYLERRSGGDSAIAAQQ
jgi:putative Holliday junction resolvase